MNTTTLRAVWNGKPAHLEDVWTLHKRNHVARCALSSSEFGWELRLEYGELFRTQVCRSPEEIVTTSENWKAAMVEKGWT
jgi:hypothetical protein